MVSFSILHRTDEQIMYEYYPENRKDKKPGIITIDIRAEKIGITTPAEDDFECCAEEINAELVELLCRLTPHHKELAHRQRPEYLLVISLTTSSILGSWIANFGIYSFFMP